MGMIISTDFIELTKVGLDEVFMDTLNAPGQLYESIFDVEDSDKPIEQYIVMAGFGLVPEWDADGGKITYDNPLIGDRLLFSHKDYGLAWKVSHKMLRDDLYKKTSKDLTQSAALSVRHSIETAAANIFNKGFSGGTSYTQLGSKVLFTTDHARLNGSTMSNLLTAAALTEESLGVAVQTIRRAKNHRGQPVVYDIDTLLVPPELEGVATQITGAQKSALLANDNGGDGAGAVASVAASAGLYTNVYGGLVKSTAIWPYLTDTNAWFLGAAKSQRMLKFFWRERPWYDADKDFDTKGVANSVAYAFSCGPIQPDGWWGNAGA